MKQQIAATQHCWVTSWKALLHVLPPTSNIVTWQNFVASWSNMLQQVELASTFFNKLFQLATTKFCCVTMFVLGGNTRNNAFHLATQHCCNVALQVEEKCCPYYWALECLRSKMSIFSLSSHLKYNAILTRNLTCTFLLWITSKNLCSKVKVPMKRKLSLSYLKRSLKMTK